MYPWFAQVSLSWCLIIVLNLHMRKLTHEEVNFLIIKWISKLGCSYWLPVLTLMCLVSSFSSVGVCVGSGISHRSQRRPIPADPRRWICGNDAFSLESFLSCLFQVLCVRCLWCVSLRPFLLGSSLYQLFSKEILCAAQFGILSSAQESLDTSSWFQH